MLLCTMPMVLKRVLRLFKDELFMEFKETQSYLDSLGEIFLLIWLLLERYLK
jgi:hypothetical protein